jgi:hypothetical protein
VDTENYDHPFANFVPNLLRHTDLPDVAGTVAPRRVTLAGTVDAAGHTMESGTVRGIYGGNHVTVRDKADWDVDVLSGWSG